MMKISQLGQGTQLSWQEYGKSTGYPVFYFHGLPGSRVEPESADAIAAELGIRLIAIDRFGYGDSIAAQSTGFSEFSDALSEIADALKLGRYSLLGFSGGTPYALACASTHPQHIDRVAVVSSAADFSTPVMQEHYNRDFKPLFELAAADPGLARQQLEPMAQNADALMQLMQSNLPSDDQRLFSAPAFHDSYFKNLETALNQGIDGVVNDLHRLGTPWPFDIREIRVPTTIWHGDEDRNCGVAIADYFAKNLADARLHILSGKGHFFIFEHWREILSELIQGITDGIV